MQCIIAREIRNYFKNPIFWGGFIFIAFGLFQILKPYLAIHYLNEESEIIKVNLERRMDADITEGYVPTTENQRMILAWEEFQAELTESFGFTLEEAERLKEECESLELSVDQVMNYMWENYPDVSVDLSEHPLYGLPFWYELNEIHPGDVDEVNVYIRERLGEHSFSWYFARKYADFLGLFLGFYSAIMLSFLFLRDTRRDMYELLHTKPVSNIAYVLGKVGGGFAAMACVWGVLTILFGILCQISGVSHGFPVNFIDFLITAAVYVLPNLLMIVSIYTVTAFLFKNPLPATPLIFLYMIYSNMGSRNEEGIFGYYGRPLAIMVRFPGRFFETAPPPFAIANQSFLILASAVLLTVGIYIWKRRRVY